MIKIYIRFIVFSVVSFIILFSPTFAHAESLIFQDDFNDNYIDSNVWTVKNYMHEDSGSFGLYGDLGLQESNSELEIYGTGSSDYHGSVVDNQIVGWVGRSLVYQPTIAPNGTLILESNAKLFNTGTLSFSNLFLEFDDNNRIGLLIGYQASGSTIGGSSQLSFDEQNTIRCVGSSLDNENQSGCPFIPFTIQDNIQYKFKLVIDFNTRIVSGFINDNLVHIGNYRGNLKYFNVGLGGAVRNKGDTIDARFDNFRVYTTGITPTITLTPTPTIVPTLTPTPIPSTLNVPDIKQYSNPWWDNPYDSMCGKNIKNVGCALTSATMILRYYNHNIWPDELNTWLINAKDKNGNPIGYNREGGVNWATVATFTNSNTNFIYSSLSAKHLEWKRVYKHDNSVLDSNLNLGRPVILNVPGHFVAAKGKSGNDYFINDPASETFNLLSQTENYHGGQYFKMETYTPTNTDLSQLYLLIDPNIKIEVFDPNGLKIDEGYALEDALTDDETNHPASKALNSFSLPQPSAGDYKINLLGNGLYQLDTYIYDLNGNAYLGNSFGSLANGITKSITIHVDNSAIQNSSIPDTSFDSFLKDWKDAYSVGKIKGQGLYVSVRELVKEAEKLNNRNRKVTSRVVLRLAKGLIIFATPKRIDQTTSTVFVKQIDYLLTSFKYH